jgi:hypothetical protein
MLSAQAIHLGAKFGILLLNGHQSIENGEAFPQSAQPRVCPHQIRARPGPQFHQVGDCLAHERAIRHAAQRSIRPQCQRTLPPVARRRCRGEQVLKLV